MECVFRFGKVNLQMDYDHQTCKNRMKLSEVKQIGNMPYLIADKI